MPAYYNEFDPGAAAWLRELIKRGLIADGEVDDRSIVDVQGADLRGFTQCHFFAGIGGWSYALRLAGWPDDRPVWTGSPPCQPFSNAGRQIGKGDDRHLAPHFADLVSDVRPTIIFGEQVASAAVFGRSAKRAGGAADGEPEWAWIDDLFGRLEAAHYACGTVDLPAACVGAPHIRQRAFFVAVRLADADSGQRNGIADGKKRLANGAQAGWKQGNGEPERGGADERLADADDAGSQGWIGMPERAAECVVGQGGMAGRPGPTNGHWRDADWLYCRDGKWRPVEPGASPLAHGLPARVVRLRGYGNAIVPQVAAEFIAAMMEVIGC